MSTTADRTFIARTSKLRPKVTNADLEETYGTAIVVNRNAFQLTLYKKLKVARTYSIAVGQVGLGTPPGLYHIQNKAVNPAWNVPEQRVGGKPGRHDRPGRRARQPAEGPLDGHLRRRGHPRHGRDRLDTGGLPRVHPHAIPDVIDLYDRVPVGAPVFIA